MSTHAPPARPNPPGSAHSARLVASGILLSRIAGLVREKLLGHYFGTTVWGSAFRAGLRMPNILQNMLGEGTLSASFIPVYSALLARGEKEAAGRVAGAIFSLLVVLAGALALIGTLLAPVLVRIIFPGFDEVLRDATIACVRIIFPMTGILVLSAWALGVLNSHGRFFLSYVAPVAWNAVIIAALLVFGGRFEGRSLMVIAAWAALLGGALQFLVQLPGALSAERSLRFSPSTDDSGVRQVLANAGPAVLGRGAVQLGAWIDQFLASFLFTGALAAMGFAQTLYVLPFSLFGMAIAAAELPQFARDGVARLDAVRERIGAGLARMVVLVVPSVVGYVLLGDIIVAALYEGGAFTADDTALVYLALAGYSLGLLPSTASRLYASAFYALNDTKTPARIALLRVVISGALGLVLMRMLEPFSVQAPFTFGSAPAESPDWRPLGVVGLAAASAVAAWFEWIQLRRRAFGRVGRIAEPHGRTVRLLAAAVIAAVPARGMDLVLGGLHPLALATLVLPVFGATYFALAHLFGVPDVLGPLRRVFRRGRG